tara:strand:+ start:409 stop:1245 length:837 start_codon:yes stop_codon:yes gene_type:complete
LKKQVREYLIQLDVNVSIDRNKCKKANNKSNNSRFILSDTRLRAVLKGWSIRWKIKQYGYASFNRKKCTNDEDFCTLESIVDIPNKYFYSICENGKYYGFDIRSLIRLFQTNEGIVVKNPFTIQDFNLHVYDLVKGKKIKITHEHIKNPIRNEAIRLFHVMDSFGHCTNLCWFLDMTLWDLKRWYRAGEDLWNYRAQLPCSTKAQISPNKRVFGTSVSSVFRFKSLALLQKLILDQIDLMICHGLSESFRALGCIYVLTIFTEINNSIAQALPAIAQN